LSESLRLGHDLLDEFLSGMLEEVRVGVLAAEADSHVVGMRVWAKNM
jgi:hypothetical protein